MAYHPRHLRRHRARNAVTVSLMAAVALVAGTIASGAPRAANAAELTGPITAAFHYPWMPQTWHGTDHFHSPLGQYSSGNPTIAAVNFAGMRYAGIQVAITSWWGIGQQHENTRFPMLYQAAAAAGLQVVPYYEAEGYADVPSAQISSDLAYLRAYINANPGSALRLGGKPVLFVYNAGVTSCAEIAKWVAAAPDWYLNMKVFSGYASCPVQPASWHQYGPASAEASHLPYSFGISAGFWHYNEATPRLGRDPVRWASNVAHLKASSAQWRLTYWDEWGEGTVIAPANEYQTNTGWGSYADEMHRQLVAGAPAPSPTASPSPSASSSPTPSPSPSSSPPGPSPSPSATPSPTSTPPPSPSSSPTPSPTPSPSPTSPPPPGAVTVMAAGDIVAQGSNGYGTSSNADGWTAELLTRYNPAAVLGLGDLQYESGTLGQYNAGWGRTSCFSLAHCDAWGKHYGQVYPAPGNHEWNTSNAQGYRDYFGPRLAAIGSDIAKPAGALYYSYDLGAWHFVSLDSSVSLSSSSAQITWIKADLANNNGRPTLVYMHHPIWSSGEHGSTGGMGPLNTVLVGDSDVQLVLTGHDHDYERFTTMGLAGVAVGGVRHFVVGTGGKSHYCANSGEPGSLVFNCTTYGVLKLTLSAAGYTWQFHPVSEVGGTGTFTDAGSSGLRT